MKNKKILLLIMLLILTGCKSKTYTITFDTNGGNIMDSITIEEGKNIENIEIPTKEGYLFVNWLKDGHEYDQSKPINEDITLTANWIETPNELYTVTFVDGENISKEAVKENDTIKQPTDPERKDYLFIGWYVGDELYDFNTKINKDIILNAKYKLDTITITYDLDGGCCLTKKIIPRNSTISISDSPIKEGYRFLKWALNNEEFSFDTKVTEDITLKAIWEKIEYITITFDTNGGNQIENQKIEKYSRIEKLPIPIKEGYIFKEWQLDYKTFNIDTILKEDITLKAIYEIKKEEE